MWKDKSGITSLRLCFPQEKLKRSHCATRLCPCGFRFRRVVAMHEASPSRPFEPFRRARPGAFAAMQPTASIRHGRSPARSSASASLCSAARACIGDCKTRSPCGKKRFIAHFDYLPPPLRTPPRVRTFGPITAWPPSSTLVTYWCWLDHHPLLAAGPHPLQGQHALLERVHHPRHRAG